MLREFLQWLATPADPLARKLGYVYSSVALEARERRLGQAWAIHHEKCHELWQQLIDKHKPQSVAIIGSGPLSECPVDFLLQSVKELHFVDLVHPRSVLKKFGRSEKVTLHSVDVTGVSYWLSELQKLDKPLGFAPPAPPCEVDLVVSANILSQLSLDPLRYLHKKFEVTEDSLFAKELVAKLNEDHFKFTKSLVSKDGLAFLYSDVTRTYQTPGGHSETYPSRVLSVPGKKLSSWSWDFCPLKEESPEYKIVLQVEAYQLN